MIGCYHLSRIRLLTHETFDVKARVSEIQTICEWIDTLVEWQPNMYEVKIHSYAQKMDIWFREEKHAIMCTLRWS